MELEAVLEEIGSLGLYQILLICLLFLYGVACALNTLSSVFIAATPEFWCADTHNATHTATYTNSSDLTAANQTDSVPAEVKYRCVKTVYYKIEALLNSSSSYNTSETGLSTCSKWDFSRNIYKSTIVSEWNLVCENKWLVATSQGVYMTGFLLGAIVFGKVGDRYGRKLVMIITTTVQFVSGLVIAFSPNYIFFTSMRFVVAMATSGQLTVGCVFCMEIYNRKWRVPMSMSCNFFFAFGGMLLAGLAYLIRNWVLLQLALSCWEILIVIATFWLPESPRWLLLKERDDEAHKLLATIARVNGYDSSIVTNERVTVKKSTEQDPGVLDLVQRKNLRWNSIIMFYTWFVCSLAYYGLSLNIGEFGGNLFVTFFIVCAMDVPANLFALLAAVKLGRRFSVSWALELGGILLLCTLGVPLSQNTLRIILAMLGKCAISAAFAILFPWTTELYPTLLRGVGLGSASLCARIGGIIAPYIFLLSEVSRPLPLVIIGIMSLLAGSVTLLLPETKGRPLPNNVEEAEQLRIGELFFKRCYRSKLEEPDSKIGSKQLTDHDSSKPMLHTSQC